MTDLDLMLRFLLQAILVLVACKAVGWVGKRFLGQTQVVMEMVTGVLLGPSLFGLLAPKTQEWLFPKAIQIVGIEGTVKHPSMMILYCVAQIGLVLYMFCVGLEFDLGLIRHRASGAVATSLAGIAAPFLLGALLALTLVKGDVFFGPGIGTGPQVLYLGAAMCITAFPMLARIIYERGISKTSMGTLALGAGATDDAVAWSLLAVVLAISKGDPNYAIFAIGGGILFAVLSMTGGKALFTLLGRQYERDGQVLKAPTFAWVLIFLLFGAWFTDAVGIYAVFGAFLTGAAMPRGAFADAVRDKIESLTVGLFLPFFFVYSGLNTKLSLVNTPYLWMIALLILAAAILGKGLACALAARATGETWRDSWAIGTLMNARGLMELIILNIGLAQKVITPTLFTIMVLMAIVTTLMASPIFQWIYRKPAAGPAGVGATV